MGAVAAMLNITRLHNAAAACSCMRRMTSLCQVLPLASAAGACTQAGCSFQQYSAAPGGNGRCLPRLLTR